MRNVAKLLVAVFLLGMPCSMSAQLTKQQQKERKTMMKASKSELNTKAQRLPVRKPNA